MKNKNNYHLHERYAMVLIMIVCICNNVNTKTIQAAIDDGAITVDAIRETTSAAGCCGKCQFKVNRILQDAESAIVTDVAFVN